MNGNAATSSAYEEGRVIWYPQDGPQTELVRCELPEVFFGGARGGGKTDGVLGKYAIKAARFGAAFNALFVRRELPMLDDAIERSKAIYGPIGAHYLKQAKTWIFPGGGRLRFRPMSSVEDAAKYQGQNVTDVCVEEAGQYPDPKPIDRLQAILRSALGVPTQLILTGNPGGAGQHWLKDRYIDPAPMGRKILTRALTNGAEHFFCFIPSRIIDNIKLLDADPDYINRLHLVGSPELVRAWLEGDWTAIEGNYFPEFGIQHIVEPHAIPEHWTRIAGFDWGSYSPFCMLWGAISDGTDDRYPKGAIIIYREYYGASEPNTGVKMPAPEVAMRIRRMEGNEPIAWRKADPSIFKQDGGPSIAEMMEPDDRAGKAGIYFLPADNTRLSGWQQIRLRLIGEERPMLYIQSNCTNLIRTFPMMIHDESKPEDMDTDTEDHALDALRYLCMGRPWITSLKKVEPMRDVRNTPLRAYMDPTKVKKKRWH